MPIYMDRHQVSNTVTAEHVAQLHQQDLKTQDEFNCKGLTYWFDDKRKMAFCLIEAPDKQAIQKMHDQAHGQVPHQIIEVDAGLVESFLGRIEDPVKAQDGALTIIDDTAFRIVMITGFNEYAFEKALVERASELSDCMNNLSKVIGRFNGRIVKQERNFFLVTFTSVTQAVICAIEVHTNFAAWCESLKCTQVNLKTGISEGVPVTDNKAFFEDALEMAQKLFYISSSKIVMSSEVKKLYKDENLDVYIDPNLFMALSHYEEKFFKDLIDYLEETWQNPDLKVADIGKHLGYGKSQVYRKMMSMIKMSPNTFIKDYRLNKSLALIKKQNGNLAEVAYEAGFNSASYFSKCFLKKFGLRPSEYLNKIAG